MTKAEIIALSKRIALVMGLCYQEERMKFCTKKQCWEGLVHFTAMARAARGKAKTKQLNAKLADLISDLGEVPVEP